MSISVYQHMYASTNSSFIQQRTVFRSVNELFFEGVEWASDSTVHSDGLTCLVSIESAVSNE